MRNLLSSTNDDEIHDLQLVLIAGGISAIALGIVVFLSQGTSVLELPVPETYALAGLTGLVAVFGMGALRLGLNIRRIAWFVLLAYTVIITIAVHYTGGPQTPMPGFYLLVIVAASFVLGQYGANWITIVAVICYALLLALEYVGLLEIVPIWRQSFDARDKLSLLAVNWLTVATPAVLTAFMCGSLAQRLKERNQQLRNMERVRKELVELLVHDLRNPLTVLLGVLDIIKMLVGKLLTEEQMRLVDNARRSGHFMLLMIGDMLDVAKLESGSLTLKPLPLDINELLSTTLDQVRALAELEGLTIHVEAADHLPQIEVDPQLIQRVLANLASNAIKHTPPGGSITLKSHLTPEYIVVDVRDTGEGIPPEMQAKIFERFGQVEKEGARIGTGLGLTFCKMAVEAHRGTLSVQSEVGKGSTFTFKLPVDKAGKRS